MIATAALIQTSKLARRALLAITFGIIQLGIVAPLVGTAGGGRLEMGESLAGNPNDLAFFVLLGIPGCILLATSKRFAARWVGRIGSVLLGVAESVCQ